MIHAQFEPLVEGIPDGFQAGLIIKNWMTFYNTKRPHSAIDRMTPDDAYWAALSCHLSWRSGINIAIAAIRRYVEECKSGLSTDVRRSLHERPLSGSGSNFAKFTICALLTPGRRVRPRVKSDLVPP